MRRYLAPLVLVSIVGCQAETFSPSALARIEVVQGEGGTAAPLEQPDSAIILRLLDDQGRPMTGVQVQFVSVTPDITFDRPTDTSGVDGLILVRPRLGRTPGTQTLQVNATEGVSIQVHLIAKGMLALLVAPGSGVTCALDLDRHAWCWGANGAGALGDSGRVNATAFPAFISPRPVRVVGGLTWSALAAGYHFVCGIATDGGTRCWGRGGVGELGRGAAGGDATCPAPGGLCSAVPAPITGDPGELVSLVAAENATCGLTLGGQAWCWGRLWNSVTSLTYLTPTPIGGATRFRDLVAGYDFVCGISTTDDVWCWGGNAQRQLGVGTTGSDTAVFVAKAPAGSHLDGDDDMPCWLTPDRQATCWGFIKTRGTSVTQPTRIAELDGSAELGALWFSVERLDARLGFSYWDFSARRHVAVEAPFDRLLEIRAGSNNGCGRTLDAYVVCWGENSEGESGTLAYLGWSDAFVWPPRFVLPPAE